MKIHPKELIEATANAIMSNFIPKNPDEQQMVFHFTIPTSSNYKVTYEKDKKGNWNFVGYELDGER